MGWHDDEQLLSSSALLKPSTQCCENQNIKTFSLLFYSKFVLFLFSLMIILLIILSNRLIVLLLQKCTMPITVYRNSLGVNLRACLYNAVNLDLQPSTLYKVPFPPTVQSRVSSFESPNNSAIYREEIRSPFSFWKLSLSFSNTFLVSRMVE